jgi:phosphomethylpyrimidine synthase
LRNGSIDDQIDDLIQLEMITWTEIAKEAARYDVNIMLEGLSHIKFGLIKPYIRWIKTICSNIPVRLLGPVGTERGLGYDHITAAICATEATQAGVDLLTCVTRAEHIGIPSVDEVREAVVANRIAIELASQLWNSRKATTNFQCGLGFENLNNEQFFDLERAVELKLSKNSGNISACSMCNEHCRIRLNPTLIKGSEINRLEDI